MDFKEKEPVMVWVYESQRPKKKDMKRLEPFIKPSIRYIGLSPLQETSLFPNSLYVLADGKRWLFLVFPTHVSSVWIGNHFTFVLDEGDKKNACHFHSTFYDVVMTDESGTLWEEKHYKDYFPETIELPTDTLFNHPVHRRYKPFLMNWIQLPWIQLPWSQLPWSQLPWSQLPWSQLPWSQLPWKQEGGGLYKKRPLQEARPILSHQFASLWMERGFRRSYAIGIKLPTGGVQWSVRIWRKGKDLLRNETAFVFWTPTDNETAFQKALKNDILSKEPFI
jgi:hypothetical protein